MGAKYFKSIFGKNIKLSQKVELVLSDGKTEFINIMGRASDTSPKLRRLARNMKLMIDSKLIPVSNDIRLLGVQFQTNNLFTKNIKMRLQKAQRANFLIGRILRNQHIDIKTKTSIYKMYLRSILVYGAPIWCQPLHTSSHQMELLRVFERSCLRSTTNIRRDIGVLKHISIYQHSGDL